MKSSILASFLFAALFGDALSRDEPWVQVLPFIQHSSQKKEISLEFRLTEKAGETVDRVNVFVGKPDFSVSKVSPENNGDHLSAGLKFDGGDGEYRVELMCAGPAGPFICANLTIPYGKKSADPAEGLASRLAPADCREDVLLNANSIRMHKGLPPLSEDDALDRLALKFSADLAAAGKLVHVTFKSGSLTDRLSAAGYRFRKAAENLASAGTAKEAFAGFIRSPSHLANIINKRFSRIGTGLSQVNSGKQKRLFVVLILADPVSSGTTSEPLSSKLLRLANEERARREKGPLVRQDYLSYSARRFSRNVDDCDDHGAEKAVKSLASVSAPAPQKLKVFCGSADNVEDAAAKILSIPCLSDPDLNSAGIGVTPAAGKPGALNFAVILARF